MLTSPCPQVIGRGLNRYAVVCGRAVDWLTKRRPSRVPITKAASCWLVVLVVKLSPETVPQGLSMKLESRKEGAAPKLSGRRVSGRCLCGAVELEIDFPAFWAW